MKNEHHKKLKMVLLELGFITSVHLCIHHFSSPFVHLVASLQYNHHLESYRTEASSVSCSEVTMVNWVDLISIFASPQLEGVRESCKWPSVWVGAHTRATL